MSTKKPRVSVIMPVYNTERYLKEAVDSILEQTFTDFELIAINDGSKDGCKEILDRYADFDARVKVVHQENQGLVATLNKGIEMAQADLIARMDADDVSFPRRFQQQIDVFDKHKDVVLVAGGFEIIDEEGEFLYREVVPANDRDIKRSMLLRNPIAHGSVMFRKEACIKVGMYSDAFGPTEDFELWSRLSTVGKFYGLEAAIFKWRINRKGISSNSNKLQLEIMKRHTAALWAVEFPNVLSAAQLRTDGRHYFQTYKKRGFDMRALILSDNAQIGLKMITHGRPLKGIHQLFAVATSTRTGLKLALRKTRVALIGGTKSTIRRYVKYGRQEV
jgi:glycosyltransferase involved in cell wall biosynthesis